MSEKIWFHWNNENDKPFGRKGSPIRHGRAWLHWGKACWGFEWALGAIRCRLELEANTCGNDHTLSLSVGIPLLQIYLNLDYWPLRKKRWFTKENRCIGFTIHHGALWWSLWQDEEVVYRNCFRPLDFLFGRQQHSSQVLLETTGLVPLPEGVYNSKITIEERSWKRKRSPLVKRRVTANVEPEEPFPLPGKGKYGDVDDAIYSMSLNASTVEQAIGKTVESVLRDRQ